MTEAEWLDCADPTPMLDYLHEHGATRPKSGQRRFRLFACACCRCVWHLVRDTAREAVEAAEAYADGRINNKRRKEVEAKLQTVYQSLTFADRSDPLEKATTGMAVWAVHAAHVHQVAISTARQACLALELERSGSDLAHSGEATRNARRNQAAMLRDLFGHLPFRPIAVDPTWLTWNDGTVRRIAQTIYDERAFDRMPILADALEDAGCDHADILEHCRGPGPHIRGCWVVDLLLGKK